ncbi:MAG: outer membrane protein assembly factor BamA [Rickettsiaceae bacterium]|nr:outer membrane protein assembly factor BamA [Rickettsiaceae bacterium]
MSKKIMLKIRLALRYLVVITLFTPAFCWSGMVLVKTTHSKIKDIIVQGSSRIEPETIVSYLALKKGDEYNQEKEILSIKELFQTDLFEDIKISFVSGVLYVHVTEAPLISEIKFSGNSRIKTSNLEKEILTHKGSSLSQSLIKSDVEKIKDLYKKSGRYAVSVEANIQREKDNRAKVIFEIKEGPKTKIRYINFVGNINYKSYELKSIILSKEASWYRFMSTSDVYDPDKIEYDKILLRKFYSSLGYADFSVTSVLAEIAQTKEYFSIIYTINEGEKFKFGKTEIISKNSDIDSKTFEHLKYATEGAVYNLSLVEKTVDEINDKLSNMGYMGNIVYPEETKDRNSKTVNVTFVIEKFSRITVDKINISGNSKTRDSLIRRQFRINEGDLFNRSAVNKAERSLRNLDFFENVNIDIHESLAYRDKVDIDVNVEEKSTSALHLQVGYNSADYGFGGISFTETNLLGTGRALSLGLQKYSKKMSTNISLTDPDFLQRNVVTGLSLFNTNAKGEADAPYLQETRGGSVSVGYEVKEDLNHSINYLIKNDKMITDSMSARSYNQYMHQSDYLPVMLLSDHAIYLAEEYGNNTTSLVSHKITYDRTDNIIIPKNGYIISATQIYSGLGGNKKYLKHELDLKFLKSFYSNDYTLKLTAEAGTMTGISGIKTGISERYSLGDMQMRGFEAAGLGPRHKLTREALSGKHYYKLTSELHFPVGAPKEFNLSGAVFCDVGGLWDYDIKTPNLYKRNDIHDSRAPRVSVGVGLVAITWIGPVRVYYALPPLKKKFYDETTRWHFAISSYL